MKEGDVKKIIDIFSKLPWGTDYKKGIRQAIQETVGIEHGGEEMTAKTTSFELSKRLYDKGLRIETEYHWCPEYSLKDLQFTHYSLTLSDTFSIQNDEHIYYPAYSTDELWEVLPEMIESNLDKFKMSLLIYKQMGLIIVRYADIDYPDDNWQEVSDESLPEALGLMVLWLLDRGYLKGDD